MPRQPKHWVYVPEKRYPFYRVGFYSNVAPGIVPAGHFSVYVELAWPNQARPGRLGYRVVETPLRLEERRCPTVSITKRFPKVMRMVGELRKSLSRFPEGGGRSAGEG